MPLGLHARSLTRSLAHSLTYTDFPQHWGTHRAAATLQEYGSPELQQRETPGVSDRLQSAAAPTGPAAAVLHHPQPSELWAAGTLTLLCGAAAGRQLWYDPAVTRSLPTAFSAAHTATPRQPPVVRALLLQASDKLRRGHDASTVEIFIFIATRTHQHLPAWTWARISQWDRPSPGKGTYCTSYAVEGVRQPVPWTGG